MAEDVRSEMEQEEMVGDVRPQGPGTYRRLIVTVASAVAVAVAFQGMHMARNNYSLWRLEFMGVEVAVALVASFVASLFGDMDRRGYEWASGYIPSQQGKGFKVLAALPGATLRGALMCAFLSVPNAAILPQLVHRETVEMPFLAVPVRFLCDLPQAILICLAVRLLVDYLLERRKTVA